MNVKHLIAAAVAVFITGSISAQQSYPDAAKTRTAVTEELAPLAHAAGAETLGEHPAVIVARTWGSPGIDPNTFIVLYPANQQFVMAPPTENDRLTREQARRAASRQPR